MSVMYNLPCNELETGRNEFWNVVKAHFQDKKIDILEIGVFKAKCISMLPEDLLNINSYIGVDPYLGNDQDTYLNSYWRNSSESKTVYDEAKEIFQKKGAQLIRKTSEDFFAEDNKKYDFIFVDGNHKYYPALWDMCRWFSRVKEGGLLMVDDYGNIDTPMVTKAVNSFCAICRLQIGRMGCFDKTFINAGKYIPAVSRYVYFEKDIRNMPKVYTINSYSSARIGEVETVTFNKKILLWGAGKRGSKVLELNTDDIAFIIDSDKNLDGKEIGGKIIRHPNTIENWKEYFVLLAGPLEIENFLLEKGMVKYIDYDIINL